MVYLDTNALIRFFTKDDLIKAQKVRNLLEKEKHVIIPDVVFPEIEYVLRNKYGSTREKIISAFTFLCARQNIRLSKTMKQAIILFAKTKLDMADCIIASYALRGKLASFDSELLEIESITPFWNLS